MRDLTLAIPQGFGKRKIKTLDSVTQINTFLFVLIVIMGLTYLFVVTSLSTKGYEIKKLRAAITQLETDQKRLQVEATDLQSISRIKSQAVELNFVPTTAVTYLKDSDYALK